MGVVLQDFLHSLLFCYVGVTLNMNVLSSIVTFFKPTKNGCDILNF